MKELRHSALAAGRLEEGTTTLEQTIEAHGKTKMNLSDGYWVEMGDRTPSGGGCLCLLFGYSWFFEHLRGK